MDVGIFIIIPGRRKSNEASNEEQDSLNKRTEVGYF